MTFLHWKETVLPERNHPPVRLSCRLILLLLLGSSGFSKHGHGVQAQDDDASSGPTIFQIIFELFFKCGVIPAEGCGLFGLGAVVRATEDPNAPGCVEKCSWFPGILAPDYFCGSCGPVDAPVSAPVDAPTPGSAPVSPPSMTNDGFQITLDLQISSQYQVYFTNSAARWEQVIVGDLPDWTVSNPPDLPDNRCSYPATIDDVYICVYNGVIDGAGKTAGFAGALARRASGDRLPVVAYAKFEEVDIPGAIQVGWFQNLIIHEFGHALGIGTEWSCPSSNFNNSPRANQEYQAISGCSSLTKTEGNAFGDSDSQCLHWKKNNCFQAEIMTNIVHPNSKLSRVSIGALEDMGYSVNYNAADNFGRSDLGLDCVCGNRRSVVRHLTSTAVMPPSDQTTTTTGTAASSSPRRQLSEAGLQDATAKGREFLKTMTPPAGVGSGAGVSEAGFEYVFVFYMEGEDAYSVYVEPE